MVIFLMECLHKAMTVHFTVLDLCLVIPDTLRPNILTYLESYPGTDNQRFRTPTNSSENLVQAQGIWGYFWGHRKRFQI